MIPARKEPLIAFDVDDTLIMWDEYSHSSNAPDDYVKVVCPHDGHATFHKVHERHVKFLKKQHAKGFSVVVWSASGTGWASAVVKALGIEAYVDFAMSKPTKYVDDHPEPSGILGQHIYLDPNGFST